MSLGACKTICFIFCNQVINKISAKNCAKFLYVLHEYQLGCYQLQQWSKLLCTLH